jgi:hypothetical protein
VSGFEGSPIRIRGRGRPWPIWPPRVWPPCLTSPSQAATGPALVAEKFTATATVVGFEVESDTAERRPTCWPGPTSTSPP